MPQIILDVTDEQYESLNELAEQIGKSVTEFVLLTVHEFQKRLLSETEALNVAVNYAKATADQPSEQTNWLTESL